MDRGPYYPQQYSAANLSQRGIYYPYRGIVSNQHSRQVPTYEQQQHYNGVRTGYVQSSMPVARRLHVEQRPEERAESVESADSRENKQKLQRLQWTNELQERFLYVLYSVRMKSKSSVR